MTSRIASKLKVGTFEERQLAVEDTRRVNKERIEKEKLVKKDKEVQKALKQQRRVDKENQRNKGIVRQFLGSQKTRLATEVQVMEFKRQLKEQVVQKLKAADAQEEMDLLSTQLTSVNEELAKGPLESVGEVNAG